MENFEYAQPKSLSEATALLGQNWSDAAVLAGGTDLLSLMKEYVVTPKRVVNVKGLKELNGIQKAGGGLRIGAAVTFDDLLDNATVRSEYPAIYQAAHGVASPQIRNMGTVGGDLCQRPRCWYFRSGNGLLAMMSGKSLVPDGPKPVPRHFSGSSRVFRKRFQLGTRPRCSWSQGQVGVFVGNP